MKKALVIGASLLMGISLAGCGSNTDHKTSNKTSGKNEKVSFKLLNVKHNEVKTNSKGKFNILVKTSKSAVVAGNYLTDGEIDGGVDAINHHNGEYTLPVHLAANTNEQTFEIQVFKGSSKPTTKKITLIHGRGSKKDQHQASGRSAQQNKTTSKSPKTDSYTSAKAYLKKHTDFPKRIVNVSRKDNILTIQLKDYSFIGASEVSDVAEIIGAASKLPLANKGVVVIQKDKYNDNNGNSNNLLSYAVYYSKAKLNQINFKNYKLMMVDHPTMLLTNASGYLLQKAFVNNDKKGLFRGLSDLMKMDNRDVMVWYMDNGQYTEN